MLSNKDINFNNEQQILTINGEKHTIGEAIAAKIGDLTETGFTGDTVGEQLANAKTYTDDLIKTEYVSTEISTMTGNSNTTVSIALTVPDGYTPIACLQTIASTRSVAITAAFINTADSTIRLTCANLYSADLSNVVVAATVGYIRSNS